MSTLLLAIITTLVLFAMYVISRPTNNYVHVNYTVTEEDIVDATVADYERICATDNELGTCIYSTDEYNALVMGAQQHAQYIMYDEYAQICDYDDVVVRTPYIRKEDGIKYDKHDIRELRNCSTKRARSATYKVGKIDRRACAYAKQLNHMEGLFN